MHHPNDDIWLIPSQKQVETLCMAMSGLSNEEIGKKTRRSTDAIQKLLWLVYDKLLVFSESNHKKLAMAACKAIRIGLVRYNYERGEYEPNPDFKMEGKVTKPSDLFRLNEKEKQRIHNERAVRRRMEAGFTDEMIQKAKENLLSDDVLSDTKVIRALLLPIKYCNSEFWKWGKTKVEELKKELKKSHPEQMKRREEILAKAKRRAIGRLKRDHPWRLANECAVEEHQAKKREAVLTD